MASICTLTQQWMTSMKTMLVLLDAEFLALTKKEHEAIIQTTRDKEALLSILTQLDNMLLQGAKETGFDNTALAEHIAKLCPNDCDAQVMRDISKNVQQANQRNGMLLQSMIRLNEHGINLLTGKQPSVNTYSASGRKAASLSSNLTKLATA
jgi:flagellar biosynthesis/type III secretory pathway chaperone